MPWNNTVIEGEKKEPVQSESLHSIALEPHYLVPQVAAMWRVSEKTVRRLFEGEAGVLRCGSSETARKRAYQNLRMPRCGVFGGMAPRGPHALRTLAAN